MNKAMNVNGYKTDGLLANFIMTGVIAIPLVILYFIVNPVQFMSFAVIYSWVVIFSLVVALNHLRFPNK